MFRADTLEEAILRAEAEAGRYVALNPSFRRIGHFEAFLLPEAVEDVDGVQTWSSLLASDLEPETFYREHYEEPSKGFLED